MRILLINPPSEKEFSLFVSDDYNQKARSNQVPLGLLYLESYFEEHHDVEILDMNAPEMPIKDIKLVINNLKPDIIGITCTIGKWLTVRALTEEIKCHSSIPIVVGGINPSLYPWETLQWPYIDYVVSGFGQIPFNHLCHNLESENSIDSIKNVYTRNNCAKNTKGSFDFCNIDHFPLPDRSILPIENYSMPFFPENPVTSMVTSMGCPYKCAFCASKNFQPVIIRKTEVIVNEMKHIESLGIHGILFNDELFTMNSKRIQEICSLIIKEEINLCWSVRSRANLIDLESLKLMKSAGCFNIHLGIESGTDRILRCMKKGITLDTIKQSVVTIKEAGLSVTASFMLGYPDESEEEILQTIEFAKNLGLNSAQFFITQPESGTELYNEVYPNGGDLYSEFTLNPDSVDLHNNIASTIFSRKELDNFIKFAYTQTPNLYQIKREKQ